LSLKIFFRHFILLSVAPPCSEAAAWLAFRAPFLVHLSTTAAIWRLRFHRRHGIHAFKALARAREGTDAEVLPRGHAHGSASPWVLVSNFRRNRLVNRTFHCTGRIVLVVSLLLAATIFNMPLAANGHANPRILPPQGH